MDVLFDIAAERAVLAGLFRYGSESYDDVADIITADSFTDQLHQILYTCIHGILKDVAGGSVDYPSVLSQANALGFAEILGRPEEHKLIRAIQNFPINKENVRKMAGLLRKLEVARDLSGVLEDSKQKVEQVSGSEPIDTIIGLAENPIFEYVSKLTNVSGNNTSIIGEGLTKYIQHLVDNPVEQVGISTGYPEYDMSIGGGLRRGSVNLVGSRIKTGKTSLADNVAIHIAGLLQIPVLNLDTEMSKDEHRIRILANLSRVDIKEIETGRFYQDIVQRQRVNDAIAELEAMPYYYNSVAGMPFEEILSIARRWVHRVVGMNEAGLARDCVIIYDYLKLMDQSAITRDLAEHQVLGFQMSALHNFMVRYDTPCLCFIQLNRDGIVKEDSSVISSSDRQAWTCSNFSIFKTKSEPEMAENNKFNRKLITVFCRHGGGLDEGDYINMKFEGQFNKITEGPRKNSLKAGVAGQSQGFLVNEELPPDGISFGQ